MSDLKELLDVLPHHHVFRWCTMGVADEDGKLIPWSVNAACSAPQWQGLETLGTVEIAPQVMNYIKIRLGS